VGDEEEENEEGEEDTTEFGNPIEPSTPAKNSCPK
jgi:hypothetical protein